MVLTGKRVLKNSAFPTRVADLRFGKVNNPIIGWPAHGGSNQKFNFAPVKDKTVKITTRTGDNQDVHLSSVDPSSGDMIQGGGVASIYTVTTVDGSYKIGIKSGDSDQILYWTLDDDTEGTEITLQPDNGNSNQLWTAESV